MRLSLYVCGVINSLSPNDSGKLILRFIFHYFTLISDFMLSNKPCRKKGAQKCSHLFQWCSARDDHTGQIQFFEA